MTTTGLDPTARREIAEVLVRYATGIDRRDWALFRTCFTADCVADYGDIGRWDGVDAITAWMDEVHAGCGHTLHRITNVVVWSDDDGDVRARSYVDAIVLGPDNASGANAVGFYEDRFVQSDEGWKIDQRRFTPVLIRGIEG